MTNKQMLFPNKCEFTMIKFDQYPEIENENKNWVTWQILF